MTSKSGMNRALVIIPTYNEISNVSKMVGEVLKQSPIVDVLIVDDNSEDGTGETADALARKHERVKVIHRDGKLGLGSAYVNGFKYALEKGYDYIFEMDCDFSHNPEEIPRFLKLMEHHDLVIGSRYLGGVSVVNWPMSRLLLSYFANIYARIVTGVPIMDLTGGFKCYRREVLEALDLDRIGSDGYGFQIETDFKACKKGFRVMETPIIFVERRAGISKMSKRIIWEAFWLVWRLRLSSLFKEI